MPGQSIASGCFAAMWTGWSDPSGCRPPRLATIQDALGVEHEPVAGGAAAARAGRLSPSPRPCTSRGCSSASRARSPRSWLAGLRRGGAVRDVQIEGAGYLNVFLDRARRRRAPAGRAARSHGGAVRGAEGDRRAHQHQSQQGGPHRPPAQRRARRRAGAVAARASATPVEVQNYIDDTGVQLADVVVGFLDLRGISRPPRSRRSPSRSTIYCWDLYARSAAGTRRTPRASAAPRDPARAGDGQRDRAPTSAALVARRIVAPPSRHHAAPRHPLRPADPRERHPAARTSASRPSSCSRQSGAVRLEKEGKNAGCWVMPLAQARSSPASRTPTR